MQKKAREEGSKRESKRERDEGKRQGRADHNKSIPYPVAAGVVLVPLRRHHLPELHPQRPEHRGYPQTRSRAVSPPTVKLICGGREQGSPQNVVLMCNQLRVQDANAAGGDPVPLARSAL